MLLALEMVEGDYELRKAGNLQKLDWTGQGNRLYIRASRRNAALPTPWF